ncbi:Fur-regulated basic protein FbpA [Robertmurraya korlensis]|uniref:Fur-regulated basic protein FbpA n=1 Tax=Robertmurraya korlensis TaxID=519977 RepID=UPI00203F7A32|nr:Fur-regulated basic protein FbpA [Robertmurraya korlensis]MCM3600861.1 Fur-regulated basic protein FbpA [Robertmurraya korlensis]
MSKQLRLAVEKRKNYLINYLIKAGIYKKNEQHLFELTLTDLELEYKKWNRNCKE